MRHPTQSFLLVAVVVAAACSTEPAPAEPDGDPCDLQLDARLLPLEEGYAWTYDTERLTSGTTTSKTQTVGALADIGDPKAGTMAFPLVTQKDDGQITVWQQDTGTAVVRHVQRDRAGGTHKDDVYTPFKGRLDEAPDHLREGATWTDVYMQESTNVRTGQITMEQRKETWTVLRYGEWVAVPAGEFCTMRISRVRTTDGAVGREKLYWFAPGVGKVKERAGSNREVLVEYSAAL